MRSENGSILIIVLWTLAAIIILVAVLTNETRFSSKVVLMQKEMLTVWAETMACSNLAKMELMLVRMPEPVGHSQGGLDKKKKNPRYLFDGRRLQLSYPAPQGVAVRVYDHAGKINLRMLSILQMRKLLDKLVQGDPQKINELIDAWRDWVDADDNKRLNGAEKDYYQQLSPSYSPRNRPFETVSELLLVRGFADVFRDVNLNSCFTMYGGQRRINPNLASPDTLSLLPGLDSYAVNSILEKRKDEDFTSVSQLRTILSIEQYRQVKDWISFSTSNFYTIAVYPVRFEEENDKNERNLSSKGVRLWAYSEIVEVHGFSEVPQTLVVHPVEQLPYHRPYVVSEKDKFLSALHF